MNAAQRSHREPPCRPTHNAWRIRISDFLRASDFGPWTLDFRLWTLDLLTHARTKTLRCPGLGRRGRGRLDLRGILPSTGRESAGDWPATAVWRADVYRPGG